MQHLLGIPANLLMAQIMLGLINGAFYALLSLGLSIIFGMLDIVNFAHGTMYMIGAFLAWMLLSYAGISYWWALLIVPLLVGAFGVVIERTMLSRLYGLHHIYGLLLTFGLVQVIEGVFRLRFSVSGQHYGVPPSLGGALNLGFMYLPTYRAWVILASCMVCVGTYLVIEKTRLGAYLRASVENRALVQSFGINVPRLITVTFGAGAALAAFAGVLAAPIYPVTPQMGSNIIIIVFGVVVVGGLGSILGSILGGFGLGMVEGLTKTFYPQASHISIFLIMAAVLLLKEGDAGRN